MADIIKETGKIATAISKSIVPVSLVNWGLIPGGIAALLIIILMILLKIPITGERSTQMCDTDKSGAKTNCRSVMISNKWNILFYIFVPLFIGGFVGFSGYQLGFFIKNPKFGTVIVGAELVKSVL